MSFQQICSTRPDGLADDNTLILDPATGTGVFLLAVLDHIREYVTTHYGTGDWSRYVNTKLVKRLFGFEILVAPYTIAHLKLSLFLQSSFDIDKLNLKYVRFIFFNNGANLSAV